MSVRALWYRQPAAHWEEALPLSDGRLGAMVFGDLSHERIALNEDTLWSGCPGNTNNPGAARHYPEAHSLALSGRLHEAQALMQVMKALNPINSRIGIILLYTAINLPTSLFIIQGFVGTIPRELDEVAREVQRPVARKLLKLLRFRNACRAFDRAFSIAQGEPWALTLRWTNGGETAKLRADFRKGTFEILHRGAGIPLDA